MKKVERNILKKKILNIFWKDPTWHTPCFQIRDSYLSDSLFPTDKRDVYTRVRSISLKAEDLIVERIITTGELYETAKDFVKFKQGYVLLIKIRSIGWKEPNRDELDDDQKKRLKKAIGSHKFATRRSQRIKTIIHKEIVDDEDRIE